MALKKCKECGKELSAEADKCPHCSARDKTRIVWHIGIIIILGIILLIRVFGRLNSETSTPVSPPRPPTAAELEARKWAEDSARKVEEQYLKTRAGKLWLEHKDWARQYCEAIVNGKVMAGMNPEQVRAAWEPPERINRTVTPGHTAEEWVYGYTHLYFDNGVVTSWQEP
jgi:hypothetical protein